MIGGVGFFVIYECKTRKIEISANGTYMRITFYNNEQENSKLYQKITNKADIQRIEKLSADWKIYDADGQSGYVIKRQLYNGKSNGIYKIIESSKVTIRRNRWNRAIESIDSKIGDWTYYKRRKPNEI